MLMMALALAAATPAPACDQPGVSTALKAASDAMARKDDAAARAAIAPAAACPVNNGPTYAAHVLAAELAGRQGDWAAVRLLLADVGIHPEMSLGARVEFLLMRADQAAGDAAAFASDRALTLVANDAQLASHGRKLETFRTGAATVTAYHTDFDQGGFHRVLAFIAVPDDKAAYPVSVMLTDDRSTAGIMALMNTGKGKADTAAGAHAWFVDLYTCNGHSSLAPVGPPNGPEPDYAAVKARAVEALGASGTFSATPPEHGGCPSANWLMPGFGLRK